MDPLKRQNSLPVLHVRGTFYEVGYNVGRTFCGLIKSVLDTHPSLNNSYLQLYETPEGKLIYDETLEAVTKFYPNYIRELQGVSDGSGVPFHKLFLLHMDEVLPNCVDQLQDTSMGCSSICLNKESHEIIGHTEDGAKEVLNNVYILDAEYVGTNERFMAFCYAGLLPGYAMGFNKHGLVYSINVIGAKYLGRGRLPRTFVTRALLAADSLEAVQKVLECDGFGIADAINVNLTFLNHPGERVFYNIEVSPTYPVSSKSALHIQTISRGEDSFHANKFVYLKIPEVGGSMFANSNVRHATRDQYNLTDTKAVYNLLSDTSNKTCQIFRTFGRSWTLAVGVFDCVKRTWSIFIDLPNKSEPIAVFPLDLK